MARSRGSLVDCMSATLHHLSSSNIAFVRLGIYDTDAVVYRMELIRDEVETAVRQVKRIKEVAEQNGYRDVLDILEEQVEFSHNFEIFE